MKKKYIKFINDLKKFLTENSPGFAIPVRIISTDRIDQQKIT